MENYPTEIQEAVKIMYEMRGNSEGMMTWKNFPLAKQIITLLDSIPNRSEHHTPYDKIFILNFIIDNISSSDTPRFTIEIMEKELALLKEVIPADLEEYNDPLTAEDIEEELQMWRDYIDTEHFSNDEWCKKYSHYMKFDPIERSEIWEEKYYEIESKIDAELMKEDMPRGLGFCFAYWSSKHKVLAEMGIEWQSPQEMNPGVVFD